MQHRVTPYGIGDAILKVENIQVPQCASNVCVPVVWDTHIGQCMGARK